MDKNAIKKYAVWARRELIDRVTKRAAVYGITKDNIGDYNAESVNGHLLSGVEKRQRQALIRRIDEKGYEQVMEEVAYTWFNRFAALRFMEVNGYLPLHIRIFTDDEGHFKPQVLAEAIHLELDGLNMEKVYQLKDTNQEEELFKYLLIVQCNALNGILPGMFQKIEDYTELLLPDYLLREGSVIEQMVTLIPEDDWKDQVQIIGWLYQYYNTEPKDKVFADLKKNIKINKESIPAATQLFTPDWIVHYMVENSLGRLWQEGHPNDELKTRWKYYIDEVEQESGIQTQLAEIKKQYAILKPEEILVIDPCAGSGHILCVLFDVLVQIYEDYGYTAREAAVSIVENNLWGLDIDDRAAQLAYFAVMMKARQYDRRFFSKEIQPNIYAIQESNGINRKHLEFLGNNLSNIERNNAINQISSLLEEFIDAKEYGSILQPKVYDWELLYQYVNSAHKDEQISFEETGLDDTQYKLKGLIHQCQALASTYHVVITNPPYMGSGNMGSALSEYVKKVYPDTKIDLSTVFMERDLQMAKLPGYVSMINIPVWMTLAGCMNFRKLLIENNTLINMLHFGRGVFGSDFGSTAFVFAKHYINSYKGFYQRLFLKQGAVDTVEQKEKWFFEGIGKYVVKQSDFSLVPGFAFAYNVGEKVIQHFAEDKTVGSEATARQGLITGDNDRFMRFWYEIIYNHMTTTCRDRTDTQSNGIRWYPYNKGGDYRKWYGNNWYVVDWSNDGFEIQHAFNDKGKLTSRPQNMAFYFKEGLTWTALTAGNFSMRYSPEGFIFDAMGPVCFVEKKEYMLYLLGLMNSVVGTMFLRILCPNLKFDQKPLENVPFCINNLETVTSIVARNVELSKEEWDSFEVSWDFPSHPLVAQVRTGNLSLIAQAFECWQKNCYERFIELKQNEEKLNRIFIDTYGLQDELSPEVDEKDVTLRKADLSRDIRSLISYAVGCILGRYSLDTPGIVYAGNDWNADQYTTFPVDKDGIIPITDDEYFNDDIVALFEKWIEIVYGTNNLEANLSFVANALGGKGTSREIIREYFLNDFYKDHLKTYQKRPIYWLFDSGKKNGFKCLIYMHRYRSDTIARIRTDYVHEQQSRYRTIQSDLEQRIKSASTSDRVKLSKQLIKVQEQAEELHSYEEKIHHIADQMLSIDIDAGIKTNYDMFKDLLAKI